MSQHFDIFVAMGVLVGNWLFVPLFNRDRSYRDGFKVGVVAAAFVLAFYRIINIFM